MDDRVLFMVHLINYNIRKETGSQNRAQNGFQKRRMTIAETGIIIGIVVPAQVREFFGAESASVRQSQTFTYQIFCRAVQ